MRHETTSLYIAVVAFVAGGKFLMEMDSLDALVVLLVAPLALYLGAYASLCIVAGTVNLLMALGIIRRKR